MYRRGITTEGQPILLMNDKQNHMKNRQRGRNNNGKPRPMGGGGGGGGRNPNFDGGGGRPRGNAQQLMEKFLAMARDASSAGDRVLAENYFQHADHYYRVLNARFEQQNGQGGQQPNNNQQHNQQPGYSNGQGRPQYQPGDDNRAGPTLHGVFGRKAGTAPGYDYSDAFRKLDLVWSAETISRLFEIGPQSYTPGTKMPEQRVTDPADRAALIDFLSQATMANKP